jgi:hypothetical protein
MAVVEHTLQLWRYTPVRADQMQVARKLFHTDAFVRTVAGIASTSILAGGIRFTRTGHVMEEQLGAQYEQAWSHFTELLLQSLWIYGFCAVVADRHPTLKRVPRVLNLEQVEVRILHTRLSRVEYVFLESSNDLTQAPMIGVMNQGVMGLMERPVPDVMVLELHPPDKHGNLMSAMVSVWVERRMLHHLMRAQLLAASHMSNPPIIVETDNSRFDPDRAQNTASINLARKDVDTLNTGGTIAVGVKDAMMQTLGAMIDRQYDAAAVDMANYGAFADGAPLMQRVVMETDQKGHTHTPAKEPTNLQHLITNFEERVGGIFGVPRSMFSRTDGSSSRVNDDTRMMFDASQRKLKRALTDMVTAVFNALYADDFILDAVLQDDAVATEPGDVRVSAVNVTLPGIPPLEVLQTMWMQGVLTYSAYIEYLSHMYSMPMNDFHKQQQLTLQELNGIKPETVSTSSAAESESTSKGVVTEKKTENTRINPKTGVTTKTSTAIKQTKQADNSTSGPPFKKSRT